MIRWILSGLAASVGAGTLLVTSAGAASGPPPPPTATNGAPVTTVASGLGTPTSFAFGGGNVFEGDGGGQPGDAKAGVFLLKNGAGTKLPGSPGFVAGLVYHKGTLYVSAANLGPKGSVESSLLAWSGWNGTSFTKQKTIYRAPKNFPGFNGLAFGPDGRLYVGVNVSLLQKNDHGPAKAPYQYDILSIKPNGKDLKVFATGMRQPWQIVFNGGSKVPYVSDLGQDLPNGINPPDFVLRVHKGDNYGFPACTWIKRKPCKGYAKPANMFTPHTDIMGLAIIGKRLYMTSFTGIGGKNKQGAGEVFSMPLKGGPLKPVLTGFVAPTVGLGAHAGSLFVGELTGQVFSVKP